MLQAHSSPSLPPADAWRAHALDAAIDAIPDAALLVGPGGVVVCANAPGRAWLRAGGEQARRQLQRACSGGATPFRRTAIRAPGAAVHHLLVGRAETEEAGTPIPTPRERDVITLLSRGATYDEIGSALGIGLNTVRTYVRQAYEKLGARTKGEAVAEATRAGWIVL